jgi:uncharacterized protein YceH (UPF0502 family)
VEYDEPTIRRALERLSRKGWVRLASGAGSRAVKYRHLLEDVLDVSDAGLALLAVLMLRGPQTPGELKQRSDRLHPFESLDGIEQTLERLTEQGLATRLPRRPGQKEDRYGQLLGGEEPAAAATEAQAPAAPTSLEARLDRLEEEVAALRRAVEALRADHAG